MHRQMKYIISLNSRVCKKNYLGLPSIVSINEINARGGCN